MLLTDAARTLCAVFLVGFVAAGCGKQVPARANSGGGAGHDAPVERWFRDVTRATGVTFVHDSGHRDRILFPEIATGGVCLFDADGDGLLDLYLVQAGRLEADPERRPTNRLYRNLGQWRLQDVTERAGVGDRGYGMGCASADYDADGDIDLYVTNLGPNVLYRNDGDGHFTDVTEQAAVGDPGFSTSAAFLDHDRDGNLDLFVVNYVDWRLETERDCFSGSSPDYCGPKTYNAPARDRLYHGLGDGRFEDATVRSGVSSALGNGLGIVVADFNRDGYVDVYVADDGTPNHLWINDNQGGFRNDAMYLGCAVNASGVPEAGMGVAAFDLENDGDLDLFMTHLKDETNTLYVNAGGSFEDRTIQVGLAQPSLALTGFGMGFADFDHDGTLDLYVANGRVKRVGPPSDPKDPFAEPNQVFRGTGDGRFEELTGHTDDPFLGASRGAAFGDLDNDGDVDIVVVNRDARVQILENVAAKRGNWVALRVLDRKGRDVAGAMVRADFGGRSVWRLAKTAYSYCASNDPRVHFGLGGATRIDTLEVVWPDGPAEAFGPVAAGRQHELRQETGRAGGRGTTDRRGP